jgi:hypothetical protein
MATFTTLQLGFASYRGWLTAIYYDHAGQISQVHYTQTLPDQTQKAAAYDREHRLVETTYQASAAVERYDRYGRRPR